MIAANELRIGNLIYQDGKPYRFSMYDFTTNFELMGFSPIPLTPEILEKVGFEKCDRGWEKNSSPLFNTVCKDGDGYNIEDEEWGHVLYRPIYFVHQFQNLYFAIMGEELEMSMR